MEKLYIIKRKKMKTCRTCIYFQNIDLTNGESISYCSLLGNDIWISKAEECEDYEETKED